VYRDTEPWDRELSLVKAAHRDVAMAEVALRQRVAQARRKGHSWAAIAFMLGTSRQAAQQRFGRDAAGG
jgi:hypothetical protein